MATTCAVCQLNLQDMLRALILFLLLCSCGFSSYYRDADSSKTEVVDADVRTQINLTKIDFLPSDNADRLMKEELLIRMERIDDNETKDYRYLMSLITDYGVAQMAYNTAGLSIVMQVTFNVRYVIVDTGSVNIGLDETPVNASINSLPNEKIISRSDDQSGVFGIPTNGGVSLFAPPKGNEAREEKFIEVTQRLRKKHKVVREGKISVTTQYVLSNILLYSDYVAREYAIEMAGRAAADELMLAMMGTYSWYIKDDYNVANEPHNVLADIDIFVSRAQGKINPIVSEYLSFSELMGKIFALTSRVKSSF